MEKIRDFLILLGAVFGLVFFVSLAVLCASRAVCLETGEAISHKTEWGLLTGCIVTVRPGLKLPIQNYIVIRRG